MENFTKNFRFEELPEFDDHKLISYFYDRESGARGFIAIHRGGNRSRPSFGATRFWHYRTGEQAARDALRLARIMSYKSAMAGLNYGGAKGVIMNPKKNISEREKQKILRAYARRVNNFNGTFITGTDAGLNRSDLKKMSVQSPFMVGLHVSPERFTALGIFWAIKGCLSEEFGSTGFSKRKFAIQGVGKVGLELLKLLYPLTNFITVADIDAGKIKLAKKNFPKIKLVKPSAAHKQEVDVYAPCALSGVLNEKTVPELRCKIVAGGANNQLTNIKAGETLYERGILYAPDYVINAGGLISVVDEYEHRDCNESRISKRLRKIPQTLTKILFESRKQKKPSNVIADEMAQKIFSTY